MERLHSWSFTVKQAVNKRWNMLVFQGNAKLLHFHNFICDSN